VTGWSAKKKSRERAENQNTIDRFFRGAQLSKFGSKSMVRASIKKV